MFMDHFMTLVNIRHVLATVWITINGVIFARDNHFIHFPGLGISPFDGFAIVHGHQSMLIISVIN